MGLKEYKSIFEALDNERRLELYDHILKKIFVSKSELAKKFELSRASLNHHLKIMINANIIYEKGLILDGRKQFFIIPAVKLYPERLIEHLATSNLVDRLDVWTKKNLTIETWRILREDLSGTGIPKNVIDAVESRLFPTLGKTGPAIREYCYICRTHGAQVSCNICKNLICKIHTHQIKRTELESIILCPNCVEKFFG